MKKIFEIGECIVLDIHKNKFITRGTYEEMIKICKGHKNLSVYGYLKERKNCEIQDK